jgi:hypothetical protein
VQHFFRSEQGSRVDPASNGYQSNLESKGDLHNADHITRSMCRLVIGKKQSLALCSPYAARRDICQGITFLYGHSPNMSVSYWSCLKCILSFLPSVLKSLHSVLERTKKHTQNHNIGFYMISSENSSLIFFALTFQNYRCKCNYNTSYREEKLW